MKLFYKRKTRQGRKISINKATLFGDPVDETKEEGVGCDTNDETQIIENHVKKQ
jgi:hypothetical protein